VTITIAIPVHNGEKFLESALDSAINQKRPAEEILVVDDGSTDRSAGILKMKKWEGRIRCEYNANPTGFVDAWNRAARYATSEFVAILHQDDLLDSEYLLRIEESMKLFPDCRHFYTGYYYIDAGGHRTAESPLPHSPNPERLDGKEYAHRYLEGVLVNRHLHRCPGVTTERALILNKCAYRKEAGLIADDDFFLRVGEYTDVVGISQPLASFRVHTESATGRLASIARQLARDYVSETRYYESHRSFLRESDIGSIHAQAVKFINTYFIEALLANAPDSLAEVRELRGELVSLVPYCFDRHTSFLTRRLWNAAEHSRSGSIATRAISICLRMLVGLKKNFSSIHQE